jgi:hypothetical protein
MATYDASVKRALTSSQQDLIDHKEHCSADPVKLAKMLVGVMSTIASVANFRYVFMRHSDSDVFSVPFCNLTMSPPVPAVILPTSPKLRPIKTTTCEVHPSLRLRHCMLSAIRAIRLKEWPEK